MNLYEYFDHVYVLLYAHTFNARLHPNTPVMPTIQETVRKTLESLDLRRAETYVKPLA